jgi:hypothetical protein
MSAALHTPAERIVMNDAVQAACQRYAHGNGSSVSIVAAVLRAAGHDDLVEALKLLDEAFCADDYGTREGRDKGRKALIAARAACEKAAGSASHG